VKTETYAFARAAFALICCSMIMATPLTGAEQTVDECSRELLLAYFPQPFIKETLKKFNVPETEWEPIQQELANKDREVIKIVEQKASQMDPNPLKDPQERQAAVKLFRETLFQVFNDVMQEHGVKDNKLVQSMLDDIQQQKAQRFVKCMQKRESENKAVDEVNSSQEEKS
jgi:hypothetical protein